MTLNLTAHYATCVPRQLRFCTTIAPQLYIGSSAIRAAITSSFFGMIMRPHSLALLLGVSVTGIGPAIAQATDGELYIVQAQTSEVAARRVQKEGGEAQRELDVINAVAAYLTPAQVASLRSDSSVRVFEDRAVGLRGSTYSWNSTFNYSSWWQWPNSPVQYTQQTTTPPGSSVAASTSHHETNYPALIGADALQTAGIKGKGVTIAVL